LLGHDNGQPELVFFRKFGGESGIAQLLTTLTLFAVSAFGPPQAASKTLRVLTEPGRGFSPASPRQTQKPAGAGFVLAERAGFEPAVGY
jgi:hypothetical protein